MASKSTPMPIVERDPPRQSAFRPSSPLLHHHLAIKNNKKSSLSPPASPCLRLRPAARSLPRSWPSAKTSFPRLLPCLPSLLAVSHGHHLTLNSEPSLPLAAASASAASDPRRLTREPPRPPAAVRGCSEAAWVCLSVAYECRSLL